MSKFHGVYVTVSYEDETEGRLTKVQRMLHGNGLEKLTVCVTNDFTLACAVQSAMDKYVSSQLAYEHGQSVLVRAEENQNIDVDTLMCSRSPFKEENGEFVMRDESKASYVRCHDRDTAAVIRHVLDVALVAYTLELENLP